MEKDRVSQKAGRIKAFGAGGKKCYKNIVMLTSLLLVTGSTFVLKH